MYLYGYIYIYNFYLLVEDLSIHLLTFLLKHFFTERTIEDHELVIEVLSNWGMEENKLYFRKNYAKYEFFKNPMVSEISINSYGK